jgi:hypothetical protein
MRTKDSVRSGLLAMYQMLLRRYSHNRICRNMPVCEYTQALSVNKARTNTDWAEGTAPAIPEMTRQTSRFIRTL